MRTSVKGGGGWSNADTCGQGGGGYEKGSFLGTSFMDDPLGRRVIRNKSGVLDLFWGLKPKETINMLVYAGSEANKRKASFNNSCVRNVFKRLGQNFQCRFDPHHSKHKGKNDQQFSYHEG